MQTRDVPKAVIDRHERLHVAAEAEVDPRTVAAYADGSPVRDLSSCRIERALRKLGLQRVIDARRLALAQREVDDG